MALGLTDENGYDLKEFDDVRDKINQDIVDRTGDNVSLDDAHFLGQIMGGIATGRQLVEQLGQLVYNSPFILRARNADLDFIGSDEGLSRKPATSAIVNLQVDADVGTVIPTGSQYSTADGVVFNTLEDAKIPEVATVKDDGGAEVPLTDDDGNEIGRVLIQAQANNPGISGNVGANTISDEGGSDGTEGIAGVVRVTNPEAAIGGEEIESEVNYRARLFENRLAKSDSTEEGIRANVENVAGVIQCKVQANNEMTTDADGNPPKTTHVYVIGGSDENVANAIFNSIGLPGHTFGEVAQTVINSSGQERTIYFSRAKQQTVYVKVAIEKTDSFDTDNGVNELKNKVIEYDRTLNMGDTLLYSKLFEYLWQVDGISSIDLLVGTDKANLTLGNVKVDGYSLAYITADDIEVVING